MGNFLHIADLHLGYRQYGFVQREEDFYAALDQIAKIAIENKVDVVISGDIFDTPKPPAKAVRKMKEFVDRLSRELLHVWGIEGNHDLTGTNSWLHVCGILPLDTPECHSCYIGQRMSLRAIGINYTRADTFKQKIQDLIDSGEKAEVLVTHTAFVEMNGDYASEFSTEEIAPLLKQLGVRYVANGHIHMWSKVVSGGITFCQPGSLEVKAINEPHIKQAALVEIENGQVNIIPIEYPVRKILVKQIDTEEDFKKILESISSYAQHLVVLYVNRNVENFAERFSDAVSGLTEIMYRISVIGEEIKEYDRGNAINSLGDAIEAYFDKDSDEYELIARCLQTPDSASVMAKEYIDGKE